MQSNGLLSSVQSLALMRTYTYSSISTRILEHWPCTENFSEPWDPLLTSGLHFLSSSIALLQKSQILLITSNGSSVLSNCENGIQSLQIPQDDRLVSPAFLLLMTASHTYKSPVLSQGSSSLYHFTEDPHWTWSRKEIWLIGPNMPSRWYYQIRWREKHQDREES